MRPEVRELVEMGSLPSSDAAGEDRLRTEHLERLILSIEPPVSDDEATALSGIFGPDECFGLAWTLVTLIESAPGWPLLDRLPASDNQWIEFLRERAIRRQWT
jgi:hypothetical protein